MTPIYPPGSHPAVALDCIIFGFDDDALKLLLIKRGFEPQKGHWSLMGGFLRPDESLDEAARRILFSLTGIQNNYLEQLHAFGGVSRDPVERTISIVYYALVNINDQDNSALKSHHAEWIRLADKPPLIFDHDQMVSMALGRLRQKAALHPIGFELLPNRFTLPQLQKLYEAIYGTQFDRRNFSRKVLATELLQDTGYKDERSVTKKGSLYTLNTNRYQQYIRDYEPFLPDLAPLAAV